MQFLLLHNTLLYAAQQLTLTELFYHYICLSLWLPYKFLVTQHHCLVASTKSYCRATEAQMCVRASACEKPALIYHAKAQQRDIEPAISWSWNTITIMPSSCHN